MKRSLAALLVSALSLGLAACSDKVPTDRESARRLVLKLSDDGSRERAAALLADAPPSVTWSALSALVTDTSASAAARVAAIGVIARGEDRDRPLPKAVVGAVDDPRAEVRGAAVDALVESGSPAYSVRLERRMRDEPDAALRGRIEASMARYEDRRREWFLRELREGRASPVRVLAARALGDFGRPQDVGKLLEAFEKSTPEVQYELILTLANIGGDEATRFVVSQLESPDPYHRAAAVNGVERLKTPTAVESLGKMLGSDSVGDNRITAAYALVAIGSVDARKALEEGCVSPPSNPVRLACQKARKSFPTKKPG